MVIEYIRYHIDPQRSKSFEHAYADAGRSLDTSEHCGTYEISRCVEDPQSYVVRIEWDSVEGHVNGFRSSAEFRDFYRAVEPYVGDIQEMRHYESVAARP